MKILCPVDFSEEGINGMEYASRLAQSLSATLTLVNVQKLSIGDGMALFAGAESESHKLASDANDLLADFCDDIRLTFNIEVDHEVLTSLNTIENCINEVGGNYDLIVIGTSGVQEFSSFYLGTHSFRVSKIAKTPVLIIPLESTFKPMLEVVFATDYEISDNLLLKQLHFVLENFKAQIKLVHVSGKEVTVSEEIFNSFKRELEDELNYNPKISFKRLVSNRIIEKLEAIVDGKDVDMLVVCFEKHSLPYQLTHRNLIKELTSNPLLPILIFQK